MSRPFLRNSLALRIALPLVLIAPVFWFAGCATPPARPQAEPLPDNEVVQTRPGATPREKMIEIALTEWDRWGAKWCAWGATIRIAWQAAVFLTSRKAVG